MRKKLEALRGIIAKAKKSILYGGMMRGPIGDALDLVDGLLNDIITELEELRNAK